jgi:hypothetical protein
MSDDQTTPTEVVIERVGCYWRQQPGFQRRWQTVVCEEHKTNGVAALLHRYKLKTDVYTNTTKRQ